jgi:WD40 repeat protein
LSRPFFVLIALLGFFSVSQQSSAQPRRFTREVRDPSLVKLAVSPDASILAIARSSSEVVHRKGKVEFWNIKTGELILTISGFDGPVWGVAFSPDGKTILTASTELRDEKIQTRVRDRDGDVISELKYWDAQTGEFLRKVKLPGEDRRSLDATWSNDGSLALVERYSEHGIISTNDDILPSLAAPLPRSVRLTPMGFSIRDTVNLKLLRAETGDTKVKVKGGSISYSIFQGQFGRLDQPSFSPDGKMLAAITSREVKVWDSGTGEKIHSFKDFKGRPGVISFSPDSKQLAIASSRSSHSSFECEIAIWDIETGKIVSRINGKNDTISALQFIAGGRALLVGSLQYEPERTVGTVKVWDLRSNRMASFEVREGESVSSVMLLPDQTTLILKSGQNVEIRDAKSWKLRHVFEGTKGDSDVAKGSSRFLLSVKSVSNVAFSPDGTTVLGEIPDEGIKLWDSRTGGLKNQIRSNAADEPIVAISSDGRLRSSIKSGMLRVWNLVDGTERSNRLAANELVSAMALSRDGKILAIGVDNEILLYDSDELSEPKSLKGHGAPIDLLVFADVGQALASIDESGIVKTWDSTNGRLKSTISTGSKTTAMAVSPTGKLLATATEDYLVCVWDARSGALVAKLKKHDNTVNALAFSIDDRFLVSGGDDRTAVMWEVATGKSKQVFKGHDLSVTTLSFSPNGKTIASGSGNASVVLWDVATGKLDRILR